MADSLLSQAWESGKHALSFVGVSSLLKWAGEKLTEETVSKGAEFVGHQFAERANPHREEVWSWLTDTFERGDKDGFLLLLGRQRERHEWMLSGGRFSRLSEQYMDEAFGHIFKEVQRSYREEDQENVLFAIFGKVARMDDGDFEAWLDAVTPDGVQRYVLHIVDELLPQVRLLRARVEELAELVEDEHRRAKSALFMLALLGVLFMAVYSAIEVVPLGAAEPFAYVGMFGLLMAGALYVWWKASTLTIALAAFNVTRPLVQVAFMVLSLAVVLLVVGIFVPTHEAVMPLQAAAVIAFNGLAFVGVWAALSGVKPIFTPQVAGFVLVGVLLVTALNGFDQQTDGAVGEFFSSAKDRVGEMLDEGPSWASRAEAAEAEEALSCKSVFQGGSSYTIMVGGTFSDVQKIPPYSTYAVSPEGPVEVLFTDGSSYILTPDGCEEGGLGHHDVAHFQVRSLSGEEARVVIAIRR